MRSAGLDEAQAGTKIAGRNINNLSPVILSKGDRDLGFALQTHPGS